MDQHEDEDDKGSGSTGSRLKFNEFDCPSCNANNPCDPTFGDGDQILCNYCGCEYDVRITEEGKPKLREI